MNNGNCDNGDVPDYYQILQIESTATLAEVKAAYKSILCV